MSECKHSVCMRREGEPSGRSWCVDCGELIFDIAPPEETCGACRHFNPRTNICTAIMMGATASLRVTYRVEHGRTPGIERGLCWEPVMTSDVKH